MADGESEPGQVGMIALRFCEEMCRHLPAVLAWKKRVAFASAPCYNIIR